MCVCLCLCVVYCVLFVEMLVILKKNNCQQKHVRVCERVF